MKRILTSCGKSDHTERVFSAVTTKELNVKSKEITAVQMM